MLNHLPAAVTQYLLACLHVKNELYLTLRVIAGHHVFESGLYPAAEYNIRSS